MIVNSDLPDRIELLLDRLVNDPTPTLPSKTFDVVIAAEATLRRNGPSDADPVSAGWPAELAEQLAQLRRLEERALLELRTLLIIRAVEPDPVHRAEISARLADRLQLLLRCTRREEFLFLRAFWLDLNAPE